MGRRCGSGRRRLSSCLIRGDFSLHKSESRYEMYIKVVNIVFSFVMILSSLTNFLISDTIRRSQKHNSFQDDRGTLAGTRVNVD